MNKIDIVEWIVENKDVNVSKKKVSEVVNEIFNIISDEIKSTDKENKIQISGFGTFVIKKRAPKIGRNPKTKEEKIIPERLGVSFKNGKKLLNALNNQPVGA